VLSAVPCTPSASARRPRPSRPLAGRLRMMLSGAVARILQRALLEHRSAVPLVESGTLRAFLLRRAGRPPEPRRVRSSAAPFLRRRPARLVLRCGAPRDEALVGRGTAFSSARCWAQNPGVSYGRRHPLGIPHPKGHRPKAIASRETPQRCSLHPFGVGAPLAFRCHAHQLRGVLNRLCGHRLIGSCPRTTGNQASGPTSEFRDSPVDAPGLVPGRTFGRGLTRPRLGCRTPVTRRSRASSDLHFASVDAWRSRAGCPSAM
jgi:hypothetical protein